MIDKKLLEFMLESNMRGELAGSFDSMEMREFLQKSIELFNENDRLQQWVKDLQSGMYINCVYCGHRYGPESEVPASMADVLKEHIAKCPKHPMSKLKQENERLQKQNAAYGETLESCLKIAEQACKHYCITCPKEEYESCSGCLTLKDKEVINKAKQVLFDSQQNYHTLAETEIIIKESNSEELLDEALAYHNPADIEMLEKLKFENNEMRMYANGARTALAKLVCVAGCANSTTSEIFTSVKEGEDALLKYEYGRKVLESDCQKVEALKLARDLIYDNMPYPANTPKYDEYFQVLRILGKAIGGKAE